MAVGSQFLTLIDMLKNELGVSTNVGVGVDNLPSLQNDINRSYEILLETYEWDHLKYIPTRISLSAGQRLYDFPANLKLNGLTHVTCWQGNVPIELERGIGEREYAIFDSLSDLRSDPTLRWDTRFNGVATQMEVWPIPASNELTLELTGQYKMARLIDDADKCWLDDRIVVLGAAVRRLARQKSDDAAVAREEFTTLLTRLRANGGPGQTVVMGDAGEPRRKRPTVSIAGR